ncbi:MAG: hypothetical protein M3Y18_09540 [Candidatus Eremiobacteraeota bacterium]|nr:hypothetical protein [Candidatus Eremiobacteraeota bacterium]
MSIRAVRARALNLPMERPMEMAAGTMTTSPVVLVDVTTDQGITGHSYARCYTSLALGPLRNLIASLGEQLTGSSERPEEAQTAMRGHFRLLGPQGLTGMAMAAIDMALWDAAAKAAGLPLFRFLGGTAKAIPAYASLRSMSTSAQNPTAFWAYPPSNSCGCDSDAVRVSHRRQ